MKYYYIPDYDTRVICYDLENNLMDKLYYAVKINNDFFIFGNAQNDSWIEVNNIDVAKVKRLQIMTMSKTVESYIERPTSSNFTIFSMVSFIDFENTTPSNTQLENTYQIMNTLEFIEVL
jgi:hypothetical protein